MSAIQGSQLSGVRSLLLLLDRRLFGRSSRVLYMCASGTAHEPRQWGEANRASFQDVVVRLVCGGTACTVKCEPRPREALEIRGEYSSPTLSLETYAFTVSWGVLRGLPTQYGNDHPIANKTGNKKYKGEVEYYL
jgi:hypothetical protein